MNEYLVWKEGRINIFKITEENSEENIEFWGYNIFDKRKRNVGPFYLAGLPDVEITNKIGVVKYIFEVYK